MNPIKNIIKNYYLFRPLVWINEIVKFERANHKRAKYKKTLLSNSEYIQYKRCQPWFKDKGDETLRLDYNLNESSIVLDVGGYKGEFTSSIFNKYNCSAYVFEPIPEFFNIIRQKFSNNGRIKPYCFGLSNKTSQEAISLSDNSSSLYIQEENSAFIQLKRAVDFINEERMGVIDLMKINIEGAEYDLLDDLISNGLVTKIKNIQVQFHDFIIDNAKERMNKIQNELEKTHELTYQYEFVWENWKLKELNEA